MENEIEQSTQDVTDSGGSSDTGSTDGAASTQEAASVKETPFHEHPRWKEMLSQRDQFASQAKQFEGQLREMQARLEKSSQSTTQSEQNKLIERLKGIDPEFGTWAEQQEKARAELQALQQWKAQAEATQNQSRVKDAFSRLVTEHKVPEAQQEIYRAMVREKAQANPNLQIDDLPNVFKEVHGALSKLFENAKRDTVASYASGKKADAAVPATTQKGGKPPAAKTAVSKYSKDPETARAQLVSSIMTNLRNQNG